MNTLFRLFMIIGFCFLAMLLLLVGLARNDQNLLAPVDFFMFLVVIVVYLLPTAVAIYRDCESQIWIALLNVLLGWTLFGWILALGWANSGKTKQVPPIHHPPSHPLPSH